MYKVTKYIIFVVLMKLTENLAKYTYIMTAIYCT